MIDSTALQLALARTMVQNALEILTRLENSPPVPRPDPTPSGTPAPQPVAAPAKKRGRPPGKVAAAPEPRKKYKHWWQQPIEEMDAKTKKRLEARKKQQRLYQQDYQRRKKLGLP